MIATRIHSIRITFHLSTMLTAFVFLSASRAFSIQRTFQRHRILNACMRLLVADSQWESSAIIPTDRQSTSSDGHPAGQTVSNAIYRYAISPETYFQLAVCVFFFMAPMFVSWQDVLAFLFALESTLKALLLGCKTLQLLCKLIFGLFPLPFPVARRLLQIDRKAADCRHRLGRSESP